MNKWIIGGVVAVVIIIGFISFMLRSSTTPDEVVEEIPTPTMALPTISGDIDIALTPKSNNQAVVLKISKIPAGTETIEYELTYTTAAGLPRGVLGKITVDGQSSVTRDDIVLGTCSSGRCVYDTGVTSIDLSLKFNSGESSSVFRKTYPLN